MMHDSIKFGYGNLAHSIAFFDSQRQEQITTDNTTRKNCTGDMELKRQSDELKQEFSARRYSST